MATEGTTKQMLVTTLNLLGTLGGHGQCCQSWEESTEQNTDTGRRSVGCSAWMAVRAPGALALSSIF